jgi:hypothetical protein
VRYATQVESQLVEIRRPAFQQICCRLVHADCHRHQQRPGNNRTVAECLGQARSRHMPAGATGVYYHQAMGVARDNVAPIDVLQRIAQGLRPGTGNRLCRGTGTQNVVSGRVLAQTAMGRE